MCMFFFFRQRALLERILNKSNRFKRQELLEHSHPVQPSTLGKLERHKGVLHEMAKRKNSMKTRQEDLQILARIDSVTKHVVVRH